MKQIGQKTIFWASGGPPLGPSWALPGPTLGTMDILNCQTLMQILTLHAAIGLQTKFQANWTKNRIFNPWAWLGPPGPTRQSNGYSKMPNIDADSYSACYYRPTNQILSKTDKNQTKNGIFSLWAHWPTWAHLTSQFGISLDFVSSFLRRAT